MDARYTIGIDLGTTNSALAYCEAGSADEAVPTEVAKIPQLVNPNEVAELTLLPSFLYIAAEVDFPKGSLRLPWDNDPSFVVGPLLMERSFVESVARR